MVVGHNPRSLEDVIQLRACTMEDDRVEADTVEERERKREFLDVIKDRTADLDNGKPGGVVWVGGGGENAEVALDLFFRADRVEQTGDSVLRVESVTCKVRICVH
jgi:hypothetical protein